ncbi:sterol desaturase family protein [uncultured Eudoraea sp.]|uniref:sterol desaturase family protein n=1 Tax=uncultured Eudoraea sp. TaxID=1035614 RepID=UPI002606EEC5|nr:sterol desaturase family protein [uncultured Eudoraea sp.]
MEKIDFLDFKAVLVLTVLLFVIIFIRFLIVSGLYHYIFFFLFRKKFDNRILDHTPLKKKQLFKELYWSAISGLIFAIFGIFIYALWSNGKTVIYDDINAYPIWYIPLSVFLALFIQDTYYYWIHRWMHIPIVYKYFHRIHHKSVHTSVLTAFSFHPLETVLQAIILPLIVVFLPMHYYALLFMLLIMTISATINHAGVEIYPSGKYGSSFGKWVIGATHHDQHHRKFRCNFGLYFTFWDKLMGTESPNK